MTGRESGAPRERLPRQARLRSGADIRGTFGRGRRSVAGTIDVFVADSPAGRPRLAVVVPRHGRSLAERNRLKRRLRELARRHWLSRAFRVGASLDLVLRARPDAYRATFEELETSLRAVFERQWNEEATFGAEG